MTLITTHMDRFGIVMATDSNLAEPGSPRAQTAQKNFPIPHLEACACVANCWQVGGEKMGSWMTRFINWHEKYGFGTLQDFVSSLRDALQVQTNSAERSIGTIIHIAGYIPDEKLGVHPVHWTVSNMRLMDDSGDYLPPTPDYEQHEHFWGHDCQCRYNGSGFYEYVYGWAVYMNGMPSGRIAYATVRSALEKLWEGFWNMKGQKGWEFRAPNNIDDTAILVEFYMRTITTLFQVSDYPIPYIGGGIQMTKIPLPANAKIG
jgi:hypothetical protein